MALTDNTIGGRVIQRGIGAAKGVLAAACKVGDLLTETLILADGDVAVPAPAKFIAGEPGAVGDTITIYKAAVIGGLSGAVLGDKVYLSDIAGGYYATPSTTSAQLVGIALSATEIMVDPEGFSELSRRVEVVSGIIDITYDLDRYIFVADRRYRVTKIIVRATAIEVTGAATTLMLEKVPSGTAIGSGTDLMAAALNLKTEVTANTNATPTLHGTPANLIVAPGDAIGLDFTNALTEFVGCVTVILEPV